MIVQSDAIAALLRRSDTADPLVITPSPNLDDLETSGSASVDLRLGTWFVAPRARTTAVLDIRESYESMIEGSLTKTTYVPFGRRFILHPQAFVLASTLEWIRLPSNFAGYVVGKSSWGRRGLIIETAMGVHPRFSGCLTLELANVGEIPIAVRPGMLICQLFLHEATSPGPYVDRSPFVGYGRPVLGHLELDNVAKKLSASPTQPSG